MTKESLNVNIPKTQKGSIDINTILDSYFIGYWLDSFGDAGVYTSDKRKVHYDYFKENAEDIVNALNYWLMPSSAEFKDKKEERRLNKILSDYIYRGDVSLGLDKDLDKSLPCGLSRLVANSIAFKRDLRSIYYHYVKINPDSDFSDIKKRYTFAQIIIENLRQILMDMWNYDFFSEKLRDENSRYELIKIIESNFTDYIKICPPVRSLRILKMLAKQIALPCISGVAERRHLLVSLLEKSTKLTGASLISEYVDNVSAHWNEHIRVEMIDKEDDADRFNSLMTDIIENITVGDLKEAESRKNRESGEKARNIKASLKKIEELLLYNNMTVNEYKSAIFKRDELKAELNKLNGIQISIDDENSKEFGYDVPYCPEDYSDEIWEQLNEDYKLFLIITELADSLGLKAGYKSVLQKKIKTHISCIPYNILRMILSKILGEEMELATVSNKNLLKKETDKYLTNTSMRSDISYTLQRIMDRKVRRILNAKEILDSKTQTLLELAYSIVKELKNRG